MQGNKQNRPVKKVANNNFGGIIPTISGESGHATRRGVSAACKNTPIGSMNQHTSLSPLPQSDIAGIVDYEDAP